uniref:Polysaccharide biosynthesis protein C-terminal domain-containing protein n=1 Tax=Aureoumbra lagunensis TaxID=44058 RepID=A0A7S3K4F4_9STRA
MMVGKLKFCLLCLLTYHTVESLNALLSNRLRSTVPRGDALDKEIVKTAVPSMANLAVVPLVGAVDTFWVGRMSNAAAQAGQAAAGTSFFTAYFLVSFIPTITAPLVAKAAGAGDIKEAEKRVAEALWISTVLGFICTIALIVKPGLINSLVLRSDAEALPYANAYLQVRSMSMIAALISAIGFAAYRGILDTVTPLRVSLVANFANLVLDPLFIFQPIALGVVGAALATVTAEIGSAIIYIILLRRKKLLRPFQQLVSSPPSLSSIFVLLTSGATMLLRQALLNISFILATRKAQSINPFAGAAYGIIMQCYSLGVVIQIAIQGTAAAIVPTIRAKNGNLEARRVADRLFGFGSSVAILLSLAQLILLPRFAPFFSVVPQVQKAIIRPARLASLVQLTNGIIFAGEGIMLGISAFRALATITALGVTTMAAFLASPWAANQLDGVLLSILAFHIVQASGVLLHHLFFSPLASSTTIEKSPKSSSSSNY